MNIKVENIVGTAQLKIDRPLNLQDLSFVLRNSEYEPTLFPGLIIRYTNPRITILVFANGKLVCAGSRTIEDIERTLKIFEKDMEGAGFKINWL